MPGKCSVTLLDSPHLHQNTAAEPRAQCTGKCVLLPGRGHFEGPSALGSRSQREVGFFRVLRSSFVF